MLVKGVLHLDLEGENVMYSAQGEPVIIDFGHWVDYSFEEDSMVPKDINWECRASISQAQGKC